MQDLRKNEKWEIRLGIVGPEAFPDDNETKNPSKCLYFSYIVSLCPSAALTETAGGRYKSWKRRWFILNDNCLYYFEYTTDKEPRGIIPLENIQVREVQDRHKPHCFELYAAGSEFIKACKTDSEGKVVEGKHTVYRMSAATDEEKEEWIKCVRQSISHNPFYDMLAARKKKAQKTNVHSKS